MITINYTGQLRKRMQALIGMGKSTQKALEEMERAAEAKLARDYAALRAHKQSAPMSLRERGAAGFSPDKHWRLHQARTRVLSDADLEDLLRWSASTGKPLNLRGCNLSGAKLRNASLRGACLAFTNASGADIDGVDLAGADLENSYGWERP